MIQFLEFEVMVMWTENPHTGKRTATEVEYTRVRPDRIASYTNEELFLIGDSSRPIRLAPLSNTKRSLEWLDSHLIEGEE